MKEVLQSSAKEIPPNKNKAKRQKWMTDEILKKMDDRRKAKSTNPQRYNELNKEICEMFRNVKEEWVKQQCQEVEDLDRQHQSKEMHDKVRELTSAKSQSRKAGCIKNKDGTMLFDQGEISDR